MLELLTIYWLLPSLGTFILLMLLVREPSIPTIKDIPKEYWYFIVLFSVLYPIGLITICFFNLCPWVAKEFKFR